MHCEGPSFTHALLMDGGTQIQGQRPQPPCSFCILESFLKTTWNRTGEVQSQYSGPDVPQDFLSSSSLQKSVLSFARDPQEALS